MTVARLEDIVESDGHSLSVGKSRDEQAAGCGPDENLTDQNVRDTGGKHDHQKYTGNQGR